MTHAERQLELACEEWRALTHAEGRAIHAANWPAVEKCQAGKRLLQPIITAATEALRRCPASSNGQPDTAERRLRDLISGLLALERENQTALAAQYRQARQQQAELSRATHNLRQVQRAYAAGDKAGWHSYS